MSVLLVLENTKRWPLEPSMFGAGVELISAKTYLTDPRYASQPRARVVNLCRSHAYQSLGYYVSLLAAARGHRPLPSIETVQDLKLPSVIRLASEELSEQIDQAMKPLRSAEFELSIYFGRNLAVRYERLCSAIFQRFPSPFLRAVFRREDETWVLHDVGVIGTSEIPDEHLEFVVEQARAYFAKPHRQRKAPVAPRFEMAILHQPDEPITPSNPKALKKFVGAAEDVGIAAHLVTREDLGSIAEYDALFIRQDTSVNHYTYRLARRATAEGLVVVDDPESIVRCSNKIFLAEVLTHNKLAVPQTLIISKDTAPMVGQLLGFPCVVKKPDSSFSAGVLKFESEREFEFGTEQMFESSDLLLAQEFCPTEFDWRIGVLDGQPLFACKYFMARKHWQILKREGSKVTEGDFEAVPVDKAPRDVVSLATKAAKLIGDGLYGVDLKVINNKPVVIEINDNPNIDAGVEDSILGDFLYERVIRYFLERLETRSRPRPE